MTQIGYGSYHALEADMRSCRKCALYGHQITSPPVFSGSAPAQVMIIGQAPGITEVKAGRPFNAGSGKRLFEWLEAAGFDESSFRTEQYMTAVTKCFPGKAKGGSGDRVPSRAERALCKPYLDAELDLIKPELVLPVGRLAIDLFFSKDLSLQNIIGSEKRHNGSWIIPLPHPSGASRWHQIPENRERIEHAIEKLRIRRTKLQLG